MTTNGYLPSFALLPRTSSRGAVASRKPAVTTQPARQLRNAPPDIPQKGPSLDGTRVIVEMPDNLGRLLTTEQAAEVLAVSVRTVKNLFSEGALAYVKIGRATRVDLSDVEQYIVRNRRKQRRSLRRVN